VSDDNAKLVRDLKKRLNDSDQYLEIYKRMDNEHRERIRALEADAYPAGFKVLKMDSNKSIVHICEPPATKNLIYARSMETNVPFSRLAQPAKAKRVDFLRNYLETLVGCDNEEEIAACLGMYMNVKHNI